MFVCEYEGWEYYYDPEHDIWSRGLYGEELNDIADDQVPEYVEQKRHELMDGEE